jgi:hypothetical protein
LRAGHWRFLAGGLVLAILWVVFIIQVAPWSEAMNFVVGVGVLALIFVSSVVLWAGYTGRMDLLEDQSRKNRRPAHRDYRDEQQAYYERRAEDARMRHLMNPSSQQPPDTDKYR